MLSGTPHDLNLWGTEIEMTDDELYQIFSLIAEKIHFIVKESIFILDDKNTIFNTISLYGGYKDVIEQIKKYIGEYLKTKILYFYSLSKYNGSHPESFRYHLRVLAKDDTSLIRDEKIDNILGE